MIKIKKLFFIALLTIATSCFSAHEVLGMGQVTLTVKNPDPYIGNHSKFIYEKQPGSLIEDVALLRNVSNEAVVVKMYAVDATNNSRGSFILTFPNEEQKTIGKWTQAKKQYFQLQPHEQLEIPFTLQIPGDVTPGQYVGAIIAELQNGKELNQEENKNHQDYCIEERLCSSNIAVKTRVGSRIYLTVPGDIEENISVTDFFVKKELTGITKFHFTIENKGNLIYEPKAIIDVYDTAGDLYEHIETTLGTSSPQTVIQTAVKMEKRPLIGKFTAEVQVVFEEKFPSYRQHGSSLTENKTVSFWAMPWELLLLLGGLLILSTGLQFKNYRARKKFQQNSEEYIVKAMDDLTTLSEERGVPWKKIAKYNNIKAPYRLHEGQIINLPKSSKNHQ